LPLDTLGRCSLKGLVPVGWNGTWARRCCSVIVDLQHLVNCYYARVGRSLTPKKKITRVSGLIRKTESPARLGLGD